MGGRSHVNNCWCLLHRRQHHLPHNRVAPQASPDEKKTCSEALAKYDQLVNPEQRKRFLNMFIQHGEGKGPDALKFAFTFDASVSHEDATSIGQVSDYITVGEVLTRNGRAFSEFESPQKAFEDAMYLVEKNMKEFVWTEEEFPHEIDADKVEYSRFYYIKSKGKNEDYTQKQSKTATGTAAIKGLKQLKNGMHFLECLGMGEPSTVTIENVKHEKLLKEIEGLKTESKKLQNWQLPFASVKAFMAIKSKDKPAYQEFEGELDDVIREQSSFSLAAMQFICECELLDKAQDPFFCEFQGGQTSFQGGFITKRAPD